MPSPFPGMNPYFEHRDAWEDFHNRFLVYTAAALSSKVGPGYLVKSEVRIYLHERSQDEKRFFGKADVGLSNASPSSTATATLPGTSAVLLTAPIQLRLPTVDIEIERQSYLQILDRRDRRVITVIELLSPSNKTPGPDRDSYLHKRLQILHGEAHFVEIDLARGGTRPGFPVLPPCDYYALVSCYQRRPVVSFIGLSLRERLPVIGIPLKPPDADVALDLQAVLNRVYDESTFENEIYLNTPEPPLSPEDAAWARELIGQR